MEEDVDPPAYIAEKWTWDVSCEAYLMDIDKFLLTAIVLTAILTLRCIRFWWCDTH